MKGENIQSIWSVEATLPNGCVVEATSRVSSETALMLLKERYSRVPLSHIRIQQYVSLKDAGATDVDQTRHRVLQAMGEQDMGKSWSWIESELKQREEDSSEPTKIPSCVDRWRKLQPEQREQAVRLLTEGGPHTLCRRLCSAWSGFLKPPTGLP